MTYTFRVLRGSEEFEVPDFKAARLGHEFSDVSAFTMSYVKSGLNADKLDDGSVLIAYCDGVEKINSRWLVQAGAGDDNPERNMFAVSGRSLFDIFRTVVVHGTNEVPNGELRFDNSTPGGILHTLLTAAQARGALTGITWTFDNNVDSAGNAWPTVLPIIYKLGLKYSDLILNLMDQGYIEFAFDKFEFKVYVADMMGVDRTLGDNPVELHSGRDYTETPKRWSSEDLANYALGIGDDDLVIQVTDNSVPVGPFGRREVSIQQGGMQEQALNAAATYHLSRVSEVRREYTRQLKVFPGTPEPLVDFNVSDYIFERVATRPDRYRVRSIIIHVDEEGDLKTADIVLNDKFLENEIRMSRKIEGISGGASLSGGNNGLPREDTKDTTTPNSPTGLSFFTDAYKDSAQHTRAFVVASWLAPTNNTDGSVITDLKEYQAALREYGDGSPAQTTPYIYQYIPPGESAYWDDLKPGHTYQFAVRAWDDSGHRSQYVYQTFVTANDATPPPKPSTPTGTSKLGTITINWNGKSSLGMPMPVDFKRVAVHESQIANFTHDPTTRIDWFSGEGTTVRAKAIGSIWYYRLVAYDWDDNESTVSDTLEVECVGITDADLIGSTLPGRVADIQDNVIPGLSETIDDSLNNYVVEYSVNTSETVPPTTGWSTDTPARTPGSFIWYRSTLYFNNGQSSVTSPALLTGNTGEPGDPGAPAPDITLTATSQVLVIPSGGGATLPATSTVTGTALNTTISTWQYSVNGGTFSETVPAGVSRSTNVVTITGSTMTANTIAVRALNAGGTVGDTVTVAKVAEGVPGTPGGDAYTVLLTNEAHSFAGSSTAALAGSTTTDVIAYKGGLQTTATIGTITGQVTGLTTAITNNGTNSPRVTVTVTTSLTTRSGKLLIPITVDGKVFAKEFSWSLNLAGTPGSDGTDAKTISLSASSQVLTSPSTGGATTPATATVTGVAVGTAISVWEYSVNGAAFTTTLPAGVTRTGNVVTVTGSTMTAQTITVRMTDGATASDTLTVAKITHGAPGNVGSDAYTILLTNEAHTFAGSTTAALAGSTTSGVIAFKGATQFAATVGTITGQVTGLTTSIASNGTTAPVITITVTTSLTATSGVLVVPITVDGKSFSKQISWTVSRTGVPGQPGQPGVGVESITPYYYLTAQGAAAPAKPTTLTPPAGWTTAEPTYSPNTTLYRTERVVYTNATFAYTDVSIDASYAAAGDARTIALGADKRVTVSLNDPPTPATGYPEGALWQKFSGNNLIAVWRLIGSTWTPVQIPIDTPYFPKIDIGTGTFGDLDGVRLKARSVLTDRLLVGIADNMFIDTPLEREDLWSRPSGVTITAAGTGYGGAKAYQVPTTSFAQLGGYFAVSADKSTHWMRVTPGEKLLVSGWVYPGALTANAGASVNFNKSSDGVATTYGMAADIPSGLPANTWTRVNIEVTVPSDAFWITPGFFTNANYNGSMRFSEFTFRRKVGTVLIEDGAVNAEHITASETLSAKIAQFLEVTTNMLTAGLVKAEHLEATMALITRIVAGDVSGIAAEMTPTGFRFFNVDNAGDVPVRYEVGSFGTSNGDTLAIRGANGEIVGGLNSDGYLTAAGGASIGADVTIMGRHLMGAFADPSETDDSWLLDLPQGVVSAGSINGNRTTPVNGSMGYGDIAFEAVAGRQYMIDTANGAWYVDSFSGAPIITQTRRWTFDGSKPVLADPNWGWGHYHPTARGYLSLPLRTYHECFEGHVMASNSLRINPGPKRLLTRVDTSSCSVRSGTDGLVAYIRVVDMGRFLEASTNSNDGGATAAPTAQIYRSYWEMSSHRTWNAEWLETHAPSQAKLAHGITSYSPALGQRSSVGLFTAANSKKATTTYPAHTNVTITSALSGRTLRKSWVSLYCLETNSGRTATLQLAQYAGTSLPSSSPSISPSVSGNVNPGSWITVQVPTSWFDATSERGIITKTANSGLTYFARYAGSGDTSGHRPRVILEYQ